MLTNLGAGLIVLAVAIVVFSVWRHRRKHAECDLAERTWVAVQGTLDEARVHEELSRDADGDRSRTLRPVVRYGYTIGGRAYEGTRPFLSRTSFGSRRQADAWAATLTAGGPVTVWHDPTDPARSALMLDRPSKVDLALFLTVAAVFACVGTIFLLF